MAQKDPHKGVDVGTKLIGEYVTDAYKLCLKAHNNNLECRADITVYHPEQSIPPAELIAILRKHNITATLDLEQVAVFCSEAAQGEELSDFALAKGVPPVNGKDGWFELVVTTGKEESELVEDEFGRIDFKSVQTFSNVKPGQKIGNIFLPTEGVPGKTIQGDIIPALPGKYCGVIAGPGVHFSEDGLEAIADQEGRAVFENNILSIAEEFVVNGDVDFSVGNISFNGFVDVKGDVLDDFNITATKGINVSGAVGACRINSDGPVTIGTMTGMGKGKIVCKGSLTARYLNQVKVECWGNVHITNEARNSIIKATGSINAPKGLLTGGEFVALEGIETKILGARSGTRTLMSSGIYFPEADRLTYLRSRLKSLVEQLKNITETLSTLNNKPLANLRPALREAFELRIGILTQRRVNLDEEREEVAEELLQFSLDDHPTANPKINILSAIKEGVVLHLGETSEELPTDIAGPVSVIEDRQNGGFRYLTYSPLKVSAEQLEEAGAAD